MDTRDAGKLGEDEGRNVPGGGEQHVQRLGGRRALC